MTTAYHLIDGIVSETADRAPEGSKYIREGALIGALDGWFTDHAIPDFHAAETVARDLSRSTGTQYLPVDNGPNVWPRFSVARLPVVGEEVSKEFNGDAYPVGKVVKVSHKGRRVEAFSEKRGTTVFWRVRATGGWRSSETWWLVAGVVSKWNPSF